MSTPILRSVHGPGLPPSITPCRQHRAVRLSASCNNYAVKYPPLNIAWYCYGRHRFPAQFMVPPPLTLPRRQHHAVPPFNPWLKRRHLVLSSTCTTRALISCTTATPERMPWLIGWRGPRKTRVLVVIWSYISPTLDEANRYDDAEGDSPCGSVLRATAPAPAAAPTQ